MTTTMSVGADACVRCHDALMFIPGITAVAERSGGPVCPTCVRNGRIELRRQWPMTTPESSRAYVDRQIEHLRSLTDEDRSELAELTEYRAGRYVDDDEYRAITPSEIERATVEAYALTWATEVRGETVDGRPCYVRYRPDSFDRQFGWDGKDWVDEDPPLVMLGHGFGPHRGDHRGGVTRPLGQVVEVRADNYGLWTRSVLWDEPESPAVMELMADGRLPAFSARVAPTRVVEAGERDGLPVYEVTEGWLLETGPTHDPADERAMILSVGGYEPEVRDNPYGHEARAMVRDWLSAAGVRY